MARVLPTAVLVFTALWLFRDLYALESNQTSNNGHIDFYFDNPANASSVSHTSEVSNNPSHSRGSHRSAWSREERDANKSDRSKEDENVSQKSQNSESFLKDINSWDMKKMLKYFVSLLYTMNEEEENPSDTAGYNRKTDGQSLRDQSNEPLASKGNESDTDLTRRKYENTDTDQSGDIKDTSRKSENNGEDGDVVNDDDDVDDSYDDGEYEYDDDDENANSEKNEKPQVTINQDERLKNQDKRRDNHTNNTTEPVHQNSSDQHNHIEAHVRNPADNDGKLNFDIFYHQHKRNGKETPEETELIVEEFIDDYINNVRQSASIKENEQPKDTAQSISNGTEREKDTSLNQNLNGNGKDGKSLNDTSASVSNKNEKDTITPIHEKETETLVAERERQNLQMSVFNDNIAKINDKSNQSSTEKNPPQNARISDVDSLRFQEENRNGDINTLKLIPVQDKTIAPAAAIQDQPQQYDAYIEPKTLNYPNDQNAEQNIYNYETYSNVYSPNFTSAIHKPSSRNVPFQLENYGNNQHDRIPEVPDTRDQQPKQSRLHDLFANKHSIIQNKYIPDQNQNRYIPAQNLSNKTSHISGDKGKLPVHVRKLGKQLPFDNFSSHFSQKKEIFSVNSNSPHIINKTPLFVKETYPSHVKKKQLSDKILTPYDETSANSSISDNSQTNPLNENKNDNAKAGEIPYNKDILVPDDKPYTNPVTPKNLLDSLKIQSGYFHFPSNASVLKNSKIIYNKDTLVPDDERHANPMTPESPLESLKIQSGYFHFPSNASVLRTSQNDTEKSALPNEFHHKELSLENQAILPGKSGFNNTKEPSFNMHNNTIQKLPHDEFNITEKLSSQNDRIEVDTTSDNPEDVTSSATMQQPIKTTEYSNLATQYLAASDNPEEMESQNDSDAECDSTDDDYSEYSEDDDSDESYNDNDEEYDSHDEEYDGDDEEYDDNDEKIIRTATTPEYSSSIDTRNSTELPTNTNNEAENVKYQQPQESFNTILEYIYRYSKNPLFTKMREQQNVTI